MSGNRTKAPSPEGNSTIQSGENLRARKYSENQQRQFSPKKKLHRPRIIKRASKREKNGSNNEPGPRKK